MKDLIIISFKIFKKGWYWVITSIKAENIDAYKLLFAEASDILNGYKRVRTYDKDVNLYYYKNVF